MKMPTLLKRNTRQREPLRSEDTDKPRFVYLSYEIYEFVLELQWRNKNLEIIEYLEINVLLGSLGSLLFENALKKAEPIMHEQIYNFFSWRKANHTVRKTSIY